MCTYKCLCVHVYISINNFLLPYFTLFLYSVLFQILISPLPNCVTLDKFLDRAKTQFPSL